MYEKLVRIEGFLINKNFVIEKNKKEIMIGNKKKIVQEEKMEKFLDSFLRIIRNWEEVGVLKKNDYRAYICLCEKDKKYYYYKTEKESAEIDKLIDLIEKI